MNLLSAIKKIWNWPFFRFIFDFFLLTGCIIFNYFNTVFCYPVWWVNLILFLFALFYLIFPLVKNPSPVFRLIYSFVLGMGVLIFIYCILFLKAGTIILSIVLLIFGVGIFGVAPVYFLVRVILDFYRLGNKSFLEVSSFFIGMIIPLAFTVHLYLGLINLRKDVINFSQETSDEIILKAFDDSYLSERILGRHFIYHTSICFYDGWRPPLHDPFFNAAHWFIPERDILDVDLKKRIRLYKLKFPQNKIEQNCACGDEKMYRNDLQVIRE